MSEHYREDLRLPLKWLPLWALRLLTALSFIVALPFFAARGAVCSALDWWDECADLWQVFGRMKDRRATTSEVG